MREKGHAPLGDAAQKLGEKKAIRQLLGSGDAKRMMELLNAQGGVQQAAKAAAAGDPAQLMEMMRKLMDDSEGAQLVERLKKQAETSGL